MKDSAIQATIHRGSNVIVRKIVEFFWHMHIFKNIANIFSFVY